jgi:hypothetical protein
MFSNTLLCEVFNMVWEEMIPRLTEADFLNMSLDGWSRTQGGEHVINFMAAAFCFSYFVDMKVAGVEKVCLDLLRMAEGSTR